MHRKMLWAEILLTGKSKAFKRKLKLFLSKVESSKFPSLKALQQRLDIFSAHWKMTIIYTHKAINLLFRSTSFIQIPLLLIRSAFLLEKETLSPSARYSSWRKLTQFFNFVFSSAWMVVALRVSIEFSLSQHIFKHSDGNIKANIIKATTCACPT